MSPPPSLTTAGRPGQIAMQVSLGITITYTCCISQNFWHNFRSPCGWCRFELRINWQYYCNLLRERIMCMLGSCVNVCVCRICLLTRHTHRRSPIASISFVAFSVFLSSFLMQMQMNEHVERQMDSLFHCIWKTNTFAASQSLGIHTKIGRCKIGSTTQSVLFQMCFEKIRDSE